MTDASRAIVTQIEDSIAIVRFNQPAQRNPLSLSTLGELNENLSTLLPREDIKAIILTGTDDVFASGADIRELSQLTPSSAHEFALFGQTIFQTIADAKQVTIAAINGYCMGGGLDLALACDIRVASTKAVFSHPGAKRGIITGWGGTQRLPRLVGRTRAMDLLITASSISSGDAFSAGLVTRVEDPVLKCALDVVHEMARATVQTDAKQKSP